MRTMADRNKGRATQHDLQAPRPDRIRNVVLVGPSGSGKTSLTEALLLATGAINRAGTVIDGTTVSDFEEPEHAHQRSVSLAVAPLLHAGTKVNLLDTPGYVDFGGEVRAGLRAADAALFVVAANESVDEATWHLWRECADVGMPRAVVVTKLDHARADHEGVVASVRGAFGDRAMPVLVPVHDGATLTAVEHLLDPATTDPRRDALIETIIEESEDEGLMDRYLAGEEVSEDALARRPREGDGHRRLPSGGPGVCDDRRRLHRAARPRGGRLPAPARAPVTRGVPPDRQGRGPAVRATPRARWSRRS